jgi:hypothetical protein
MPKRRELIKLLSIAGGTTAVHTWREPIVKAVMLPAHAEATTVSPPGTLLINLRPTFNPRATTASGQSCGSPTNFFPEDLVFTNTLGCTANLVTDTLVGADDLLEINGSEWTNPQCGSATTQIPAETTLLTNIAPGASITIRVLDTVSVNCTNCTSASGTLRLECVA